MGIMGLYRDALHEPTVGKIVALHAHDQLFEIVRIDNKFVAKVWMKTYCLLGLSDGKTVDASSYDVRIALDPVGIAKWKKANGRV